MNNQQPIENGPIHKSVLTKEVIEALNLKPGGIYVDATLGAGGHTRAILKAEPECKIVGIDVDKKSMDLTTPQLLQDFDDRFIPLWANFSSIYRLLKKKKIHNVDGVLADFGTSQDQIFGRAGFSFSKDTPLDMRMSCAHGRVTAADFLKTRSERDISDILFKYGQEKHAKRIARRIVELRKTQPIDTTLQLANLVSSAIPKKEHKRIHPATRTFQALRIVVNREIEHIEQFLPGAFELLNPGGRLVCISFHSLEDRPVKQFFLKKSENMKAQIITKKPITASDEEIEQNPSSRSAKMRILEKLN